MKLSFISLLLGYLGGTLATVNDPVANQTADNFVKYLGVTSNNDELLVKTPENFNLLVANDKCSFKNILIGENKLDFTECDKVHENAKNIDVAFRTGSLVSLDALPDWLVSLDYDFETCTSIIKDYVTKVIDHFNCTEDDYIDVFTEASDTTENTIVSKFSQNTTFSMWLFNLVKEMAPEAKLIYNIKYEDPTQTFEKISNLKANNVLFDVVGLIIDTPCDKEAYYDEIKTLVDNLASIGAEVQISEIKSSCAAGLVNSASLDIFKACYEHWNCPSFIVSHDNLLDENHEPNSLSKDLSNYGQIEVSSATATDSETVSPTLNRRAMTTTVKVKEVYEVFMEGDTAWDPTWEDYSWADKTAVVKDGVIVVVLKHNDAFSLTNNNLSSTYGFLDFEFKLEPPNAKLNHICHSAINQDKYYFLANIPYTGGGEFQKFEKEEINKPNDEINRFTFQNYDQPDPITLYIKNIVYTDMEIVIEKYSPPINIISPDCSFNSEEWEDKSIGATLVSHNMNDGLCNYEYFLDENYEDGAIIFSSKNVLFTGGKISMKMKSSKDNNIISVYAIPEDESQGEESLTTITRINDVAFEEWEYEFEYEKVFKGIKVVDEYHTDVTFTFESFSISPIEYTQPTGGNADVDVTETNEPIVILDYAGLKWDSASWGCECELNSITNINECTIGENYSAFSAQDTEGAYVGGNIVVKMRVEDPTKKVTIQIFDILNNNQYNNIKSFEASNEMTEYTIPLPDDIYFRQMSVQDGSKLGNKFYIDYVVYYAPNVALSMEPTFGQIKLNVTKTDVPIVIYGESTLSWKETSWGCQCSVDSQTKEYVCSVGTNYAAFSAQKDEDIYKGGKLLIKMKVDDPSKKVNVQIYDLLLEEGNNYSNIKNFEASTEMVEYIIDIPNTYFRRIAIQDYSNLGNTFYIESIIYYAPNVELDVKPDVGPTVEVTPTEKPIVIYSYAGLKWQEASWSCECEVESITNYNVCLIDVNYGAFSVQNPSITYKGGNLVLKMKVEEPERSVNIQIYDIVNDGEFFNAQNIMATNEMKEYTIALPEDKYFRRISVQDGTEFGNVFYIEYMVYYAPNVDLSIEPDLSGKDLDVTKTDKPIVVYSGNTGLKWSESSWSCECVIENITNVNVCTIGENYGAFSVQNNDGIYKGGNLLLKIKSEDPSKSINIQTYDLLKDEGSNYVNVINFFATAEMAEYTIPFPDDIFFRRISVQDGTKFGNIFYIEYMVYYAPNVDLSVKPDFGGSEPGGGDETDNEETKYAKIGYNTCSSTTKIVYSDEDGIWGLENNDWCAILKSSIEECWSLIYGIPCCSSASVESKEGDTSGAWGIENGVVCGIPDSSKCWASQFGYECCSHETTKIITIDSDGAWGAKDNKWCGIN